MAAKQTAFPVRFRFPLAKEDRREIEHIVCRPGNAAAALPEDALHLAGVWNQRRPLMLRPMFPGLMRCIPLPDQLLPAPGDIEVVNGRVTDLALKKLSKIIGYLRISVVGSGPLEEMKSLGAVTAIGMVPELAIYGPVTFGVDFLRKALLNHNDGLVAAAVIDESGKKVAVGGLGWGALALSAFLAGRYEPRLRCGIKLEEDDAGRLPMPSLPIQQNAFSCGITLGWPRVPREAVDGPLSPQLETIPVEAFMKHVATLMREPDLSTTGADPVIQAVLAQEYTADGWTLRLKDQLRKLGFGATKGCTPIDIMLREFQLCASSPRVATPVDPTLDAARLARRDFRDLKPIDNLDRYQGPISGFANRRTRELIQSWSALHLRNPLLMVAFPKQSIVKGVPSGDPLSGGEDVWGDRQLTDTSARVYAANLMRGGLPERPLEHAQLERVGCYVEYQDLGGPRSIFPDETTPFAAAEILPERLTGRSSAELMAALASETPADAALRAIASSFRVIRAVSEVECLGYFDVINAYDGAGISLPPCHWAMAGTARKPQGGCELGGLAALLATLEPTGPGLDVFRRFGMTVVGKDASQSSGTVIATLGFLDDRDQPRFMSSGGPKRFMPSWRSLYRWTRVGREDPSFGPGTWRMALRRLATIHATPIGISPPPHDPRFPSKGPRTIGEVFTSELLMAELLRWHVKIPTGVVKDRKASAWIELAYAIAAERKPAPEKNVEVWERYLQEELMTQIDAFKIGFPEHKELPGQFVELASPHWIDQTVNPPRRDDDKNKYHFSLNPQLRLLKGTFRLAKE